MASVSRIFALGVSLIDEARLLGRRLLTPQHLGAAQTCRAPEHDEIDQRVGAQAVRSMHGHAGRFAQCHEARHDSVLVVAARGDHFAMHIGRNAAHIVVAGRNERDRFVAHIDAAKNAGDVGDARKPFGQHLLVEMIEMEMHVVLFGTMAAAFAAGSRLDRGRERTVMVLALVLVAAVGGNVMQIGFHASAESLAFKTETKKFEFYSETLKKVLGKHAEKHKVNIDKVMEVTQYTGRGEQVFMPHWEPAKYHGDEKEYPFIFMDSRSRLSREH